MRSDLPSGTVTFVFTDVEGSTRLLGELGAEAYAAALAEHRGVVRAACASRDGVEVDTQGDALFVAFATAPGALAACARFTHALADGPIRVRVGVHTGTPLLTEEGYVGHDVHRAARIAAAGHGGQVLVSSATAALVGAAGLRDLGEHRFKDLQAAERVYQLGEEGEFPPLRSLYRSNLPVPATPFLGRDPELADVVELLSRDEVRLLTLTGPGGTGKTRLALQAAADASDSFPDGVWWVPLAALRDPALIVSSLAHVLEVKERPGRALLETVVEHLSGKRLLVLLDNVEHLLPAAAGEIAGLRAAAGPTLLVTSRERLQLDGEHSWPVPPLEMRDGIKLFLARARQVDPSFVYSSAVDELCERLDQLPLALELAAARTSLFSADQLIERLGQRLELLKGGRDADPRQQTLRATIEWSYDLLGEAEQRLFRSLSVFAGGCTYEAAEAVCDADTDTLQSLLDKSLVRRRDTELGPRYWMLETIRQYGETTFAGRREAQELLDRLCLFLARDSESLWRGTRNYDPEKTAYVAAELGNFRVALAHALERKDVVLAGDLLYATFLYLLMHGYGAEAARLATVYLDLDTGGVASPLRLTGLLAAGEVHRHTGQLALAEALKEEYVAIARAHLDSAVGDHSPSRIIAGTLSDLAFIKLDLGRPDEARANAEEALALRRAIGDPRGIGHALAPVAAVAFARSDFRRARAVLAESAALLGGHGDDVVARLGVAECEVLLDDLEAAARVLAGVFEDIRPLVHDVTFTICALRVAGMLGARSADPSVCVTLFAAAGRIEEDAGVATRGVAEAAIEDGILADAEEQLGDEALAAQARGHELDAESALELAASVVRSVTSDARR